MENLQEKLEYRFKGKNWLKVALTHRSFGEGMPEATEDNEKLEFLGDAVIGLLVTENLFRRFPELSEGELAKMKAHLVSTESLYQAAGRIDLADFLLLGKGEERNRGRQNRNIVSSAFEAVIGAIYLDGGLKAAQGVLTSLLGEAIGKLHERPSRVNDFKSELQEVAQKFQKTLPIYRVVSERGKPPHTEFVIAIYLDGTEVGRGRGRSKREAEQEAACVALRQIGPQQGFSKLSDVFLMQEDKPSD